MVGFVIPFKPSIGTSDWVRDNKLLERTLKSLLNQSSNNFRIFVVCTDIPSFSITDNRVSLVKPPFPFVYFNDIPNSVELVKHFYSKAYLTGHWDKGRKICYGSLLAKEAGCKYIMAVDADDLISNRLVEFVVNHSSNNTLPGWFINKGYFYRDSSDCLIKSSRMNYVNGTTHVIREDLVKIPDFSSEAWEDYNFFTDHGFIRNRVKSCYNEDLSNIPFYAVIYIAHSNNLSNINNAIFRANIKSTLKKILLGVTINTKIKTEFSLYSL